MGGAPPRTLVGAGTAYALARVYRFDMTGKLPDGKLPVVLAIAGKVIPALVGLFHDGDLGKARMPLEALDGAERDQLRVYAEVPLSANLPRAALSGEVNGVFAPEGLDQEVSPPYLLIVAAKRGVEGHDTVSTWGVSETTSSSHDCSQRFPARTLATATVTSMTPMSRAPALRSLRAGRGTWRALLPARTLATVIPSSRAPAPRSLRRSTPSPLGGNMK